MESENTNELTTVVIHLPTNVRENVDLGADADLRTRKAQCEFYVRQGAEKQVRTLKKAKATA